MTKYFLSCKKYHHINYITNKQQNNERYGYWDNIARENRVCDVALCVLHCYILELIRYWVIIMSVKTETVRARVNHQTKVAAERILKKLGLSMSETINLLLIQIKLRRGLPFKVRIPNAETCKILEESTKGKNIKRFDSVEDLFDDLED